MGIKFTLACMAPFINIFIIRLLKWHYLFKVPINSRNLHNVIFRIVEIGVAIWFPAVLWNCMQPSELWILNPRKLLAKGLEQQKSEHVVDQNVKVESDNEAFLDRRECWICYDADKKEPLIQPCDCTGDVSSVHHECLRRYVKSIH